MPCKCLLLVALSTALSLPFQAHCDPARVALNRQPQSIESLKLAASRDVTPSPPTTTTSGTGQDGKSDWIWRALRTIKIALQVLLTWPVVVLVLVIFLATSHTAAARIAGLFLPLKSVKVFGAELVFTPEAKVSADEVLDSYKKQVKTEFDRRVDVLRLWDKMERVVDSLKSFELKAKEFRCTIHVPDVLFQDTLYQLVDYYPKGGGRGRRWSQRFGMIGLAWRSCEDQVEGNVSTDPDDLLRHWGMKKHEATAAGTGRPSFACVVLTDESSTPVGLFYLDSEQKQTFGTDAKFNPVVRRVKSESQRTGLAKDLADLGKELRRWGPVIRLYDDV
jgi:hypothetical protein